MIASGSALTGRVALLVAIVAVLFGGPGAARSDAVTLYGGGSLPPTTTEPVPLFLVVVERGRASVVGFSGGRCSNGRMGFGRFVTKPARLRRGGRLRTGGSFAFNVAGGVARGVYHVRARVRPRGGLATGTVSVRVRFPSTTGKPITCRGLRRRFRARNPAVARSGRVRGPFYGLTSQGLPILIRPSPDSSTLAPVELWSTLSCNALGQAQPIQRLTVPTTAPGIYAKSGHTMGTFTPALGSTVSVPAGTYTYSPYTFHAQIANGHATGIVVLSSQVGNAQRQLIDTCSVAPITFVALP
jgi:hypothetical protein